MCAEFCLHLISESQWETLAHSSVAAGPLNCPVSEDTGEVQPWSGQCFASASAENCRAHGARDCREFQPCCQRIVAISDFMTRMQSSLSAQEPCEAWKPDLERSTLPLLQQKKCVIAADDYWSCTGAC